VDLGRWRGCWGLWWTCAEPYGHIEGLDFLLLILSSGRAPYHPDLVFNLPII
jgi:hypothetical protein